MKKYIATINQTEVFSPYVLPWDAAVAVARINKAGNGQLGDDLICKNGQWYVHAYNQWLGFTDTPIYIDKIWSTIQEDWDTASFDSGVAPKLLDINDMADKQWAYPEETDECEFPIGWDLLKL